MGYGQGHGQGQWHRRRVRLRSQRIRHWSQWNRRRNDQWRGWRLRPRLSHVSLVTSKHRAVANTLQAARAPIIWLVSALMLPLAATTASIVASRGKCYPIPSRVFCADSIPVTTNPTAPTRKWSASSLENVVCAKRLDIVLLIVLRSRRTSATIARKKVCSTSANT